jgi:Putative prokaryotic signal transducing protein
MATNPTPLPDPNEKLVRVFDTEQESEAIVVSGLLESEGIDCEITALDVPQDVIPIGGTVILVRQEDAPRALQLIEEYRRTPEESAQEDSADSTESSLSEDPQPEK